VRNVGDHLTLVLAGKAVGGDPVPGNIARVQCLAECHCYGPTEPPTCAQREANAHLIAAAPLMRDALQITHDMLARQLDSEGYGPDSWGDDEHEAFRALKQALAAAEGK
jgi:hypothetical protein